MVRMSSARFPLVLSLGLSLLSGCDEGPAGVEAPEPDAPQLASGGNRPPLAVTGGPYTGIPGVSVQFDGSGSYDPDGPSPKLTYAWNFGDGTTGSGVSPTHTYRDERTYIVVLTVTDAKGARSQPDSTTATIAIPPNQPPVANPGGPYDGTEGEPMQFDGGGSADPEGGRLTYAWTFGDGGTGSGTTATHTYAAVGTYTVTLVVTDSMGLSSEPVSTTATVSPPNQAPVADAGGPYSGTAGSAIAFDGGASSDPDGDVPLTYAWSFGDGSTGTGPTPSHTYAAAGTYTVTLTVTDALGAPSSPSTTTARVEAPPSNQAPVAQPGGPYSGEAGTAIQFDGSGSSDPEGGRLTYAWNFGDGSSGTGANPLHTYAAAGSYTVTLVVTDSAGLSSAPATTTASVVAAPANQAPVAQPGGPYSGTAGAAIRFDGSGSSDPEGGRLTYAWSFGDGSTGTGVSPSHAYAAGGTYTVTLVVTDSAGLNSAPAATTASVTGSTSTVLVADAFSRTVSNGWGSADVGGLWRIDFGARPYFRVNGSQGQVVAPDAAPRNAIATEGYGLDVTGLASFSIDTPPDNASRFYTIQVYARRNDRNSDGDNYYRYRVRAFGNGTMDVRVEKNVNTVHTWLADARRITAVWAPRRKFWIRWECIGASPSTAVRMRVWADGTPEPSAWDLALTVNEPALDVSGTTGFRVSGPSADQVTFPITFSLDDLEYRGRP